MNSTHLHLVLSHFPVIGLFFAIPLLFFGLLNKSRALVLSGLIALTFIGLVTIPVYLTGEEAEEVAEHLVGVSERVIHHHEEAAESTFVAIEILGGLALLALVWTYFKKEIPGLFIKLILLTSLVSLGMVVRTANLGGKIRHTEIEGKAERKPKKKKIAVIIPTQIPTPSPELPTTIPTTESTN